MEHHIKNKSWNDQWQLEGWHLEKLHYQYLQFDSLFCTQKIRKSVHCLF